MIDLTATSEQRQALRIASEQITAALTDPRDSFHARLDSPTPDSPLGVVVVLQRRFEGETLVYRKTHILSVSFVLDAAVNVGEVVVRDWMNAAPDSVSESAREKWPQ